MWSLVKGKFMQYLTPITIGTIVILLLSTIFLTNAYLGKVEEVTTLESKLEQKELQIEELNKQLTLERETNANVKETERIVETRYIEIEKNVKEIPVSETVLALDPSAVAIELCRNGLAEPSACKGTN
ncbi:hypothetical protein [Vibrio phage vB_VmeM-Yong XC32]|nr:hypothetical protein [Vibrio phage vB_VmeM-Yong XC31]QAX96340.1 hypothetical protein [Vibrio phage vB_VmeM-Yong XC32]QAX96658.1 hypothetical protein [Vibrio phage vB_VmeM-Yong MS31]QAX96976.1 hypothetical protein [Vibrio phage vB_VmeM-Yong MS32]